MKRNSNGMLIFIDIKKDSILLIESFFSQNFLFSDLFKFLLA